MGTLNQIHPYLLEIEKKLTNGEYVDWHLISTINDIPESFLDKYKEKLVWNVVLRYNELSEKQLEKYIDYIPTETISMNVKLSENFIEKNKDKIDFKLISKHQDLSENFIEKYKNDLDWELISANQKLSEDFIEKHANKVDWSAICMFQKLSENFIEKHHNDVNWELISLWQKLSEDFIERNIIRLSIKDVVISQKLSKDFFKNREMILNDLEVSFKYHSIDECFNEKYFKKHEKIILKYQKLSEEFIKKFNIKKEYLNAINWLYKSAEKKKQSVIDSNKYECHDDYFIAYKAIRKDRYSFFNFQYKYEPGVIYESWCDCTDREDSFGLSVGTKRFAQLYGGDKSIIVRCKIKYEDVGRIVHNGDKIRCFKIEVLD